MSVEPQQHVAVRVSRRFQASPERVFDAWLDPEKVMKWMSLSGEIVRAEVDARVGGSFSFVCRQDGEEVDHVGEYLEMDRPRRLVFTWSIPKDSPDADRVVIDIVPQGTGCELTLLYELHPDWAAYASQSETAWRTMLDAIAVSLGEPSPAEA